MKTTVNSSNEPLPSSIGCEPSTFGVNEKQNYNYFMLRPGTRNSRLSDCLLDPNINTNSVKPVNTQPSVPCGHYYDTTISRNASAKTKDNMYKKLKSTSFINQISNFNSAFTITSQSSSSLIRVDQAHHNQIDDQNKQHNISDILHLFPTEKNPSRLKGSRDTVIKKEYVRKTSKVLLFPNATNAAQSVHKSPNNCPDSSTDNRCTNIMHHEECSMSVSQISDKNLKSHLTPNNSVLEDTIDYNLIPDASKSQSSRQLIGTNTSRATPTSSTGNMDGRGRTWDRLKHTCPYPRCGCRFMVEATLSRHLTKCHGHPPSDQRASHRRHRPTPPSRRPASEERSSSTGELNESLVPARSTDSLSHLLSPTTPSGSRNSSPIALQSPGPSHYSVNYNDTIGVVAGPNLPLLRLDQRPPVVMNSPSLATTSNIHHTSANSIPYISTATSNAPSNILSSPCIRLVKPRSLSSTASNMTTNHPSTTKITPLLSSPQNAALSTMSISNHPSPVSTIKLSSPCRSNGTPSTNATATQDDSAFASTRVRTNKSHLIRLIFACPIDGCTVICRDRKSFQTHFKGHLNGLTTVDRIRKLFSSPSPINSRPGSPKPSQPSSSLEVPSPFLSQLPSPPLPPSDNLVDFDPPPLQLINSPPTPPVNNGLFDDDIATTSPIDESPDSGNLPFQDTSESVSWALLDRTVGDDDTFVDGVRDNHNLLLALDLIPDDLMLELLKSERDQEGWVDCLTNTMSTTTNASDFSLASSSTDKVGDGADQMDAAALGQDAKSDQSPVQFNIDLDDSDDQQRDVNHNLGDHSSWLPSAVVRRTWSSAVANEAKGLFGADCPHHVLSDLAIALIPPDFEHRLRACSEANYAATRGTGSRSAKAGLQPPLRSRDAVGSTMTCGGGKRRRNASDSYSPSTTTIATSQSIRPSFVESNSNTGRRRLTISGSFQSAMVGGGEQYQQRQRAYSTESPKAKHKSFGGVGAVEPITSSLFPPMPIAATNASASSTISPPTHLPTINAITKSSPCSSYLANSVVKQSSCLSQQPDCSNGDGVVGSLSNGVDNCVVQSTVPPSPTHPFVERKKRRQLASLSTVTGSSRYSLGNLAPDPSESVNHFVNLASSCLAATSRRPHSSFHFHRPVESPNASQ